MIKYSLMSLVRQEHQICFCITRSHVNWYHRDDHGPSEYESH
jgi:hypothetical protein